jgi:hypothetical protein
MSVGFALQNEYDIKILVSNNMPMYPKIWTEGATTDNWKHYTRVNPANNVMKNIEQKLSPGNGRIPVRKFRPRHFLLINTSDKK